MRAVVLASLAVLLVVLGAGSLAWERLLAQLAAPRAPGGAEKTVVVPPGTAAPEVGQLLVDAELVRPSWLFDFYLRRLYAPEALVPGQYTLSASQSPAQMLASIEAGRVLQHTVSWTPGSTSNQVVEALAGAGLADPSRLRSLIADPGFVSEVGLAAPTLEGQLFPDAYVFPAGLAPEALLTRIAARGRQVRERVGLVSSGPDGRPLFDALRVASLVERASLRSEERRAYAALLYNRLDAMMPLDLEVVSLPEGVELAGAGLPEAPICNPGEGALAAAAHPAPGRSLYMAERDDGTHVFCEDVECYVAALRRYDRPIPAKIPRPRR